MKLVLDQNLARSLKLKLRDLCADIVHVRDFNLETADDQTIWQIAKDMGGTIVTKDRDFMDLSHLYGHPPHVVLMCLGNCPLKEVETAIRRAWSFVERLHQDSRYSLLMVSSDTALLLFEDT